MRPADGRPSSLGPPGRETGPAWRPRRSPRTLVTILPTGGTCDRWATRTVRPSARLETPLTRYPTRTIATPASMSARVGRPVDQALPGSAVRQSARNLNQTRSAGSRDRPAPAAGQGTRAHPDPGQPEGRARSPEPTRSGDRLGGATGSDSDNGNRPRSH